MLTEYLSSIRVAVTTKRWKLGHDRKLQQHLVKLIFKCHPHLNWALPPRFKLLTLHKNIGKKHKIHCSRRKTQKHLNYLNFLHPLPVIQSPSCLLLLSNTKPWEDEQSHHHWTPTLLLQSNNTRHITLWCCRNPGSCPWILCMLIMYFLQSQHELW
jgi:hypothetical protein